MAGGFIPLFEHVPSQWPERLPARIAFVAEAPGETEIIRGIPLVGNSGRLFNMALRQSGINRDECFVTNVLDFQLPENEIKRIAVPKTQTDNDLPPVCAGGYLINSVARPALARLREELAEVRPNIIVAMGGVAAWALLGLPGNVPLKKIRGTVHQGTLYPAKVLPTYHPAFILRKYQMYPIFWADLLKAARESLFPEIRRVELDLLVPESVDRMEDLFERLSWPAVIDIETARKSKNHPYLIDCIGFSDGYINFTVPIFDNKTFRPFWSERDEIHVRRVVSGILQGRQPKIFQNGSYDVQVLWERWKVAVHGYTDDTRLLHHALWPELPKDLASMAACHTDLPSWKPLKTKGAKRDE